MQFRSNRMVSERHRERLRGELRPLGAAARRRDRAVGRQGCRPHEGHVASDRRALAPALSVAAPARLPRPVQRSVDQDIVARKREPASVSSQARARTSRAASFGRDSFSPVACSAACRRLPTVFR